MARTSRRSAWTADSAAIARDAFQVHRGCLGLTSGPVEWHDGYVVGDAGFNHPVPSPYDGDPDYPELASRLAGLF